MVCSYKNNSVGKRGKGGYATSAGERLACNWGRGAEGVLSIRNGTSGPTARGWPVTQIYVAIQVAALLRRASVGLAFGSLTDGAP